MAACLLSPSSNKFPEEHWLQVEKLEKHCMECQKNFKHVYSKPSLNAIWEKLRTKSIQICTKAAKKLSCLQTNSWMENRGG